MNREERRQLAMRIRRGIATDKELEALRQNRSKGGYGGGGYASGGWAYYVMPNGWVTNRIHPGARILRRAERRRLVGIRAWRSGTRAPTSVSS